MMRTRSGVRYRVARRMLFKALGVLALTIAWVDCGFAADIAPADHVAFHRAMRAMCGKSIVLLGEATHGDGHAIAVKAALVEHLVSRCGFKTVLFESSFYEFVPVARSAKPSPALIAAAVGGLWKFDQEMQPLFDFLARRTGKLRLGGLDFQAGGFEQPYSNDVMIDELTADLPTPRRDQCRALYHARIYGDAAPNGMSAGEQSAALISCVNDGAGDALQLRERANLAAWLSADGRGMPALVRARDRMMAENVARFLDRPGKVLIWTANAHAAKVTTGLTDYADADNLGAALRRRYGGQVFALAITARGGEYRWSQTENKTITPPAHGALEASVGRTTVYLDARALKQAGACSSGVYGHSQIRADWAEAFDGVLVLDAEYPPHDIRASS